MSVTEQQARRLLGEAPDGAKPEPPRRRGSAAADGADRPQPRRRRTITATEIIAMQLRGRL